MSLDNLKNSDSIQVQQMHGLAFIIFCFNFLWVSAFVSLQEQKMWRFAAKFVKLLPFIP
jgi:hypothetical protein